MAQVQMVGFAVATSFGELVVCARLTQFCTGASQPWVYANQPPAANAATSDKASRQPNHLLCRACAIAYSPGISTDPFAPSLVYLQPEGVSCIGRDGSSKGGENSLRYDCDGTIDPMSDNLVAELVRMRFPRGNAPPPEGSQGGTGTMTRVRPQPRLTR